MPDPLSFLTMNPQVDCSSVNSAALSGATNAVVSTSLPVMAGRVPQTFKPFETGVNALVASHGVVAEKVLGTTTTLPLCELAKFPGLFLLFVKSKNSEYRTNPLAVTGQLQHSLSSCAESKT